MTGRYYTSLTLSAVRCPRCHGPLPIALVEAGITEHPMCEWEASHAHRS